MYAQIMLLATRFCYIIACLFNVCAYSHVTIKQAAVAGCYIEVMFISILILKAFDSTKKLKRVCFQSRLQAFKRYICLYKEQKGHSFEENEQRVSSFFQTKPAQRIN